MFARREFAHGGVALAAKALLRTLRRRQFLLRLGRAASETIHRRRDLVVHRALGGEHLDLHHGILQLARQSLASRLEGGALRLGLLVRLRDVLEGALGLAGQALVVELEAAELVARAVALDAGDVELGAEVGRLLMHAEHGELLQGELGGILGLELAEALLRADDAAELLLAVGDRLAKGRSEALELGVLVLEELDRLEHLRALLGELALLRGERLLRERIARLFSSSAAMRSSSLDVRAITLDSRREVYTPPGAFSARRRARASSTSDSAVISLTLDSPSS